MHKYTLEYENNLDDLVTLAMDSIKEFVRYDYDNKKILKVDYETEDQLTEYIQDETHEIIDSCVPVYTYELDVLFFLFKGRLMDAFNDAGICTIDEVLANPDCYSSLEGVAIFCYLEQEVNAWIHGDKTDFMGMSFCEWFESQFWRLE